MNTPLFTNDAIVFGILISILAFVFTTSKSENPFWKKFYKYIPTLLLCYFIPSIFNSLGIISGEESNLYFVASRYLLPTSLVLLTISIDLPEIKKLGPKAIIMFLTATAGIILGGPLAILIVSTFAPDVVGVSVLFSNLIESAHNIAKVTKQVNKNTTVIKHNGLLLNLNLKNPIDREIYLTESYENTQVEYFKELIIQREIEIFIDIGSHMGFYTINLSKVVKKSLGFFSIVENNSSTAFFILGVSFL